MSLEDVLQDELAAAHPALSEVPEGLLTPRGSVQNKRSAGSTAPGSVDEQLRQAKAFLETMEGHSRARFQKGVTDADSTDVRCPRGCGAVPAGSPGGHHRGDQRPGAGPRSHRGDLTMEGYRWEFEEAREYFDRLECPNVLYVVMGNHDAKNVGYRHFEEFFGIRERSAQIPVPEGEAKVVCWTLLAGSRRGRGRTRALQLARLRVPGLGPWAEDTHDPPPHPRRPGHGTTSTTCATPAT